VLGIKAYDIEATEPIPAGTTQVRVEFAYDGGGIGEGGDVTLYYDGKDVGKGRVDQTQGFIFSADETTDVGYESGTTVSPDYTAHTSRFSGKIDWVRIDLGRTPKTPTTTSNPTNASGLRWRGNSQVCDLAPTISRNRTWRSASSRGSLYRWKPALFIAQANPKPVSESAQLCITSGLSRNTGRAAPV